MDPRYQDHRQSQYQYQVNNVADAKFGNSSVSAPGNIFSSEIKVSRPTKIQFKTEADGQNDTKEMIRTARSGSIKQKLNLENTRLKINV